MTDPTWRTPTYANRRACRHRRHGDIARHRLDHAGQPHRRQNRSTGHVTGAAQQKLKDTGRITKLRYQDREPSGGTTGCLI